MEKYSRNHQKLVFQLLELPQKICFDGFKLGELFLWIAAHFYRCLGTRNGFPLEKKPTTLSKRFLVGCFLHVF